MKPDTVTFSTVESPGAITPCIPPLLPAHSSANTLRHAVPSRLSTRVPQALRNARVRDVFLIRVATVKLIDCGV